MGFLFQGNVVKLILKLNGLHPFNISLHTLNISRQHFNGNALYLHGRGVGAGGRGADSSVRKCLGLPCQWGTNLKGINLLSGDLCTLVSTQESTIDVA